MNRSAIGWTDLTSNPIRYRDPAGHVVWGCERTSPGCAHCYAAALAKRYGRGAGAFTAEEMATYTPFLDEKEVHRILTATVVSGQRVSGSRCFIGDMTDIFGEWVPDELLDRLFTAMALRMDVTFQVLTKRPDRMRAYMQRLAASTVEPKNRDWPDLFGSPMLYLTELLGERRMLALCDQPDWSNAWPLPNVWLGTSVENQHWANERIPQLLQTPAAVRFISAEPLLGPIDLMDLSVGSAPDSLDAFTGETCSSETTCIVVEGPGLDWVIVGGESGQHARPVPVDAITSIVRQCAAAGVQAFVKQDCGSKPGLQGDIPDDIWAVKQFPAVAA